MDSFYVLCPIPGTEQYDEFHGRGVGHGGQPRPVRHDVLDWRHPNFSREQLAGLLFRCYRKFYSSGHAVRNWMHLGRRRNRVVVEAVGITATSLFNQYCAWRRTHPMSGGVVRVRRDRVDDYLALRKEAFGFELVRYRAACNWWRRTAR